MLPDFSNPASFQMAFFPLLIRIQFRGRCNWPCFVCRGGFDVAESHEANEYSGCPDCVSFRGVNSTRELGIEERDGVLPMVGFCS